MLCIKSKISKVLAGIYGLARARPRKPTTFSGAGVSGTQSYDPRRADFDLTFDWLSQKLAFAPDPSWTVLEVGYGKRGWAPFYKQYFDCVYGVDIEDFSSYNPGVNTIIADITKERPLPPNSIDLVVSHSVFEHLSDVEAALANINKVLKVRGHVLITISPLYYSASGSHVNSPSKLTNWEHLDPDSDHFMIDNPLKDSSTSGHLLNKLTYCEFLGHVGKQPWSIINCLPSFDMRTLPSFLSGSNYRELDLRLYGFMFVGRKDSDITS